MALLVRLLLVLVWSFTVMAERPVPKYLQDAVGKRPTKATISALEGEKKSTFLQGWVVLQIHYASENYDDGVRNVLPKLPLRLRQHYLVFWAEYRIGNGGLDEFFELGSEVPFLEETITAFADMGLPRVAEVLRKAAKIHAAENRKLLEARKRGKEEQFMEEYGHNAYEQLHKAYDDLSWFFLDERLRFIERHIDEFDQAPNRVPVTD